MKKSLGSMLVALFVMFNFWQVSAQTQNYLTTSGNKLYDVSGDEVRLTGVNWFGFETALYSPHGIWSRDMKSVLQQIKDMGFNTIRVPWCNEMLDPGASVNINSYGTDAYSGISPMNEEEGTVSTPIELLDIFVDWCQENDMKIVLDNHSRAADGFLVEGLWYTDEYSEERWINDWIFIAERYKGISAVVAMDLNNEPHDSSWGDSTPETDWNKAAERCGNAILEVNPDVLIIVEGVGEFEGNSYWWGGNLMGAEQYPIELSDPSKLMYSAHEYGPEVSQQDWFEDASFPNNMPEIWNDNYDYLYENNTSPLFVGEFGIKNQDAFDGIAYTWFTEFMSFMGDRYSWTFWTINPNSGDTGGILQDDWTSVNQWKLDVLTPHVAPLIPNIIGNVIDDNNPPVASFVSANNPCETPRIIEFNASGSTDPDGDSLTYSWDFGDGNTGNGVSVIYDYADFNDNLVTVTLTVSDGEFTNSETEEVNLEEGTTCTESTITDLLLEASVTSGEAPLSVSFVGEAIVENGDTSEVSYNWSFDNGASSSGDSASTIFTNQGEYTVTLTAVGPVNSFTENITINVTESIEIDSDLSLNYRNGGNDPTDNSINPHFEIINNGSNSVAYSDLSIRYWFTSEGNDTLNYWCDWAQLGTSNVLGSFGTANGVNYLEITFSNTVGNLDANSNSGSIQNRFAKTDWSSLNENDDYSYDNSKTSFTAHEQVTLYQNGSLVWGVEPDTSAKSLATSPLLFSMFPNPTTDLVTIENSVSFENANISISNLSGKTIKTVAVNSNTNTLNINTTDLDTGIYVITIISEARTYSKMLIIK